MEVYHFDRDSRSGNYTFEQLFGTIRKELNKFAEVKVLKKPDDMGILKSIHWAKKNAGPLNHITGDVNYLALGLPAKKTIITVHDLGHYTRTLRGLKKMVYKKLWMDLPFSNAIHLTAISEFTKGQLIDLAGISESKITVIKNPVLPFIQSTPLPDREVPVILQVGSGTNKNLERLIYAIKGLRVKLLLINRLEDPNYLKLLNDFKIDFEQRTDLNSEELNQAYADCDILFFASEYEGFGMPILEAQAAGRPVITSNVSAMPEAAGRGAILVNPFDLREIRASIIRLIDERELRQELIAKGKENLIHYQVESIARAYLELYDRI